MKEKLSHLYMIKNIVNGKKYFGITTQNPPIKRWIGHKTVARRKVRKTPLVHAMNKYGFDNFTFEVLVSDEKRDYIYNLEKEYIKKYKTQNREFGYNLSDGGEINIGFTIPKNVIEKRSRDMKGKGNHFYGRSHTEETKKKISNSKKGVKLSEETKSKMKGRKGNLKGVTGEDHPCFGRIRPESERIAIKMNTPHRKEVLMIDKDTDEILMHFFSKKEAGNWLIENNKCRNKNTRSVASGITRAINNNLVSYGYKWREVDERQSTIETAL